MNISESEMTNRVQAIYCSVCSDSLGDIFMCGEGMVCVPCFSKYSGLSEADAFFETNITSSAKSAFRVNRNEEISQSSSR